MLGTQADGAFVHLAIALVELHIRLSGGKEGGRQSSRRLYNTRTLVL